MAPTRTETKSNWLRGLVKEGRGRKSSDRGMSLVTVAALGVVVSSWLFAISASVLPMFQRAAIGRYTTILRCSAEAGLDYVVDQLNNSITNGQITSSLLGASNIAVPAQALGNSAATVNVSVAQMAPPPSSAIYESWSKATDWQVVTATASYAGMQKSIRVVLAPQYNQVTVNNPYFTYGMWGSSFIIINGNGNTAGWSQGAVDPLGGNIGSNGYVSMSGNATIGGSINVFAGGTSTLVNGSGVVNNQVINNGSALPSSNFGVSTGITVKDQGAGNSQTNPYVGAIVNQTNNINPPLNGGQLNNIPPALTIPSTEPVVSPTITQSGTGGNATFTVQQPAAGTAVNLGSLSQSGNQVWKIPPGDYEVNSLTTTGNGSIQLVPGANGAYGPVRFFVQGTSSSNAVQISGNGVVNGSGSAANFQIWYSGSKGISLSGNGSMYGVVYAPKAQATITGNGSIYGAVYANTVTDSGNGTVYFDESLKNNSNLQYGVPVLQYLQAITWQEL